MPRPAFKPDSSFFRKIALGAVGARAVCGDLNERGHLLVELERGATDTKLWKDVKRKRVRIPDLVCTRCGLRIESRAKTKADLSMSHSAENSRAWDFGMVDTDLIAFPVCVASREAYWSRGKLGYGSSYWHEKNWVQWRLEGTINYFTRRALRDVAFVDRGKKGVTEGSEATIGWPATFSRSQGTVQEVRERCIVIRRQADNRVLTRTIRDLHQESRVAVDQTVGLNQVIASGVRPMTGPELVCTQDFPREHIACLLASREKTQRFTGLKLARLRNERDYCNFAGTVADDTEEDIYVRFEAIAYLASVCDEP
ncbi:MAG: HEAT repeat domain-containing protein, partial [Candidatus Acidiferrales bacterium]